MPQVSELTSEHSQSYQPITGPIPRECYCAVTHCGSDERNIAKKTVSFLLTAENSVPVYALCANKEYGRDRRFLLWLIKHQTTSTSLRPSTARQPRHKGYILNGNATFKHHNVALLAVNSVLAPEVMSSAEFDERLAPSLKRLRLSKKLLERVSGVKERRWWSKGVEFDDAAIVAGKNALTQAGVEPGEIGLLINTSVTRRNLEPSVASKIHNGLGLPSSAMNFDITNACLGFVNGMSLAANMIDSGQIKYALIVAGEDSRPTQETTFQRLNHESSTREDYMREFATLTLGSGAAAAVIGPADLHPDGHRIIGGVSRAGTEHHELCVGGPAGMYTDTKGLLDNGLELVVNAWDEAQESGWNWKSMDRYVTHQVSKSYTNAIIKAVGLVKDRVPITFSKWGNVGPASLPMTLSQEADTLKPGDRVLCMGVGSGLNTAMMEIAW